MQQFLIENQNKNFDLAAPLRSARRKVVIWS